VTSKDTVSDHPEFFSGRLALLRVLQQHPHAVASHFHYAACVHALEVEFESISSSLDAELNTEFSTELLSALSCLLFDLEVINALALSDWEVDARPMDWPFWQTEYAEEANDLLKQMHRILSAKQDCYIRDL